MQGSGGEEYGREADEKLYTINLLMYPKMYNDVTEGFTNCCCICTEILVLYLVTYINY